MRTSTPKPLGLSLAAVMGLLLGCTAVDVSRSGAECNQSDSTVTCCLKQHPGQYEPCGVTPPPRSEPIHVGPPGLGSLGAEGSKEARGPDEEERREERDQRCADYYARCIEEIGQKPGSLYGTSQCRDCFVHCSRHGFWPARVNKKKCPGA